MDLACVYQEACSLEFGWSDVYTLCQSLGNKNEGRERRNPPCVRTILRHQPAVAEPADFLKFCILCGNRYGTTLYEADRYVRVIDIDVSNNKSIGILHCFESKQP